jgi:hypothetical protein
MISIGRSRPPEIATASYTRSQQAVFRPAARFFPAIRPDTDDRPLRKDVTVTETRRRIAFAELRAPRSSSRCGGTADAIASTAWAILADYRQPLRRLP